MPVTEQQTLTIVCDNIACPGNDLPTDERTGWLFVSGEVYGEPTLPQLVVCSAGCLSTFSQAVAAASDEETPTAESWTAILTEARESKAPQHRGSKK